MGTNPTTRPVDIEDLVIWTYRDQKADRLASVGLWDAEARAAGFDVQRVSACGVAKVAAIANLGARVDTGGIGRAGKVHHDAEVVHSLVQPMGEAGLLVIAHGRAATRPADGIARPRLVPAMWKRPPGPGRPGLAEWSTWDDGSPYTPLMTYNNADEVAHQREIWATWWRALWAVAKTLQAYPATLRHHRVTGFDTPQEPWSGEFAVDMRRTI